MSASGTRIADRHLRRSSSNAQRRRIARGCAAGAAARRALDVAMGRGRHALALARAGFRVFGVDARFDAVRDAVAAARPRRRAHARLVRRSDAASAAARAVRRWSWSPAICSAICFRALRGGCRAWRRRALRNVHDGAARARTRADVAGSPARAGRAARGGSTGSRCCSTRKSRRPRRSRGSWRERRLRPRSALRHRGSATAQLRVALQSTEPLGTRPGGSDTLPGLPRRATRRRDSRSRRRRPGPDGAAIVR